MATAKVNGIRLHHELQGDRGIPLVLVHGSWDSHGDWGEVVAPMLEDVKRLIGAVVERIASGDHAGAAEQFVETVALGPVTWVQIPPEGQKAMIENAPTFLDEANDPEALVFDMTWLAGFSKPTLLTMGDHSPPTFAPVVRLLSAALPHAEVITIQGAGHVPHSTHPDRRPVRLGVRPAI